MKIVYAKDLAKLARALEMYISIDGFLSDKKIPCVVKSLNDTHEGECEALFEFAHKHWGKTVYKFWTEDFCYFVCGGLAEIRKAMKKELKEIEDGEEIEDECERSRS